MIRQPQCLSAVSATALMVVVAAVALRPPDHAPGQNKPPPVGGGLIADVEHLKQAAAPVGTILAYVGEPTGLKDSGWALCDNSPLPADADKALSRRLNGRTPNLMDAA